MLRVYSKFIFSTSHTLNFWNKFPQKFQYSTSSSSSVNDFAEYLVNSLGFSHENAITTSTKLLQPQRVNYSNLSTNAVSVVNFFKDHSFDDAHIRKIVSLFPNVLTYGVDKTIKPKLGFLIDQGFSGFDLISVVTKSPWILAFKFDSKVSPAIQGLREILVCNAHVIAAFKNLLFRDSFVAIDNLSPNVAFLTSYGVPIELIRKHLVRNPISFLRNPESFKDIVVRISEKHGFSPSSTMFLYCVLLFSRYPEENIESKCRMFKSFGWTQVDVETLMMKNSTCFTLSDENIKKKLSFLMHELKLEPSYLISRVALFTCSLETRTMPRHDVLQILEAKGLLEKRPDLYSVVCMSEPQFFNLFVMPFEEVHQVYANHFGCISLKTLIQERTSRRHFGCISLKTLIQERTSRRPSMK